MRLQSIRSIAVALAVAACSGRSIVTEPPTTPADTAVPPIVREMRGLWIATVANIDWPSRPGLSAEEQRAELSVILDEAAATGFNAVIVQVRPAADAVYRSALEPWGAMLGGQQGMDPGYDPLTFAIDQAHARGLELHAWINPFRAGNARDSAQLAPTHSFNVRRDVVRVYGSLLWLDPGAPAAHDHVMAVVRDIVQRYDVDAIHADDYFYPYPQDDGMGQRLEFPDAESYARSGSALSVDDWRRANVDRFIERMYREIHELEPAMKVGISPFGIWRPGHPTGVAGLDAFAAIYADARRWLREGWVDYFAPQLYWAIGAPQQSFPALFDWWLGENPRARHVWPGIAAYRVGDGSENQFTVAEIPNQVDVVRSRAGASGYLLYNTTSTLWRNGGAVAASLDSRHSVGAVPPPFAWLDAVAPPAPTVTVAGRTVTVEPGVGEPARWWLVRARSGGVWSSRLVFADQRSITLAGDPQRVLVNAIDRAGNASADSAGWPE